VQLIWFQHKVCENALHDETQSSLIINKTVETVETCYNILTLFIQKHLTIRLKQSLFFSTLVLSVNMYCSYSRNMVDKQLNLYRTLTCDRHYDTELPVETFYIYELS